MEEEAAAELRRIAAPAAPRSSARPGAYSASTSRATAASPRSSADLSEGSDDGDEDEDEPLTAEEERQAVTDFALMQLAERDGHRAPPGDLVFEPTDPFMAEAMRDRALERFFSQRGGKPGPPPGHGAPTAGGDNRAQRAPAGVKWTVGSRPRPTPPPEDPPRRKAAKSTPGPSTGANAVRTAKAAPAKKSSTKKSSAKKPPARKPAVSRTKAAPTPAEKPVAKRAGRPRGSP